MYASNTHVEVEQLDHQRARLEELLANERLSQDLSKSIKRLVDDITRRMIVLKSKDDGVQLAQ